MGRIIVAVIGLLLMTCTVYAEGGDGFGCGAKFAIMDYPKLMREDILRNRTGERIYVECTSTDTALRDRLGDISLNFRYVAQGNAAFDINSKLTYGQICRTLFTQGANFNDTDWTTLWLLIGLQVEEKYAQYTIDDWANAGSFRFITSLLPPDAINKDIIMFQTIYLLGDTIRIGNERNPGFQMWFRAKIDLLRDLSIGRDIRKYTNSRLAQQVYQKAFEAAVRCRE